MGVEARKNDSWYEDVTDMSLRSPVSTYEIACHVAPIISRDVPRGI